MVIHFDILQTLALAVVVMFLGKYVKRYFKILDRLCIPDPVVGGILFSLLLLIGHSTKAFTLEFDLTLQSICMTAFFTSVGFSCNLRARPKYGLKGLQFTIIVFLLVICQNIIGIAWTKVFDINAYFGLCAGSVSMVGGHGTSGAFAPLFEQRGCAGALTVAMAAATFGLVSGGLIGGPVARYITKSHNLAEERMDEDIEETPIETTAEAPVEVVNDLNERHILSAANLIILAMGIGTILSMGMTAIGLTFPGYMGGMLMAVILRNISDFSGLFDTPMNEINCIGNVSLLLFVTMALMTLKLWQLAELAIPLIVMLMTQVVFITVFLIFIGFKILGSDYDGAVMISGICGFGLGAMPNGVANMQAFVKKFKPSPTAFFVVPGVGSVIIDVVNAILITAFMGFIG